MSSPAGHPLRGTISQGTPHDQAQSAEEGEVGTPVLEVVPAIHVGVFHLSPTAFPEGMRIETQERSGGAA